MCIRDRHRNDLLSRGLTETEVANMEALGYKSTCAEAVSYTHLAPTRDNKIRKGEMIMAQKTGTVKWFSARRGLSLIHI